MGMVDGLVDADFGAELEGVRPRTGGAKGSEISYLLLVLGLGKRPSQHHLGGNAGGEVGEVIFVYAGKSTLEKQVRKNETRARKL
jgi:hypothetical protein